MLRWPDIGMNESCQLERMLTQTSVLISLYNKDSNGCLEVTFMFTRFNGFTMFLKFLAKRIDFESLGHEGIYIYIQMFHSPIFFF